MIICFFEYQKQHWVDWYKSSHCFQWTYLTLRAPWPSYMNDICKWLYAFLNIKNSLELTDTKGHIAFNEPTPILRAPWPSYMNDVCKWLYAFLECQKQPWVIWYKRPYCFQWTYPILRAPWPSYINDVCKWLYTWLEQRQTLE